MTRESWYALAAVSVLIGAVLVWRWHSAKKLRESDEARDAEREMQAAADRGDSVPVDAPTLETPSTVSLSASVPM